MTGTGGLVRTIGLRHLRERRLRSLLTIGGIAAGVALVFSITSMNAALDKTVRSTVAAFQGPADLQVTAVAPGTLGADAVTRIRAVGGVATAAPILESRTALRAGSRSVDGFVIGVTSEVLAFAPDGPTSAGAGAGDGLAVGAELARRLHLTVGDHLTVATRGAPATVRVGVVLPPGPLDRIDGGLVVALPLPSAQALLDRPDQIDLVLIDIATGRDGDEVRAGLRRAVGSAAVVTSPSAAPGDRAKNVQPFLLISEAVGLISLFVAFVLVFNAMSMAMAERRTELALAAALGARRRQLFVATLGEAALLGVAGTLAGLALGALLADELLHVAGRAYRFVLPVDPPTTAVLVGPHLVIAALGGVAVAILGAALPARRVLRTAPVAALRPANDYEWLPDDGRRRSIVPLLIGSALLAAGVGLGLGLRSTAPSLGRTVLIVVAVLLGVTLVLPAGLPLVTERIARVLERRWRVVGRLAGDALRANPRRTSVTLLTLILPLATVIGTGTAFSSAEAEFHRLAETFISAPITVTASSQVGYTALQPLPASTAGLLEAIPGVRGVLGNENMFLTTGDGLAIVYAIPLREARRKGLADVVQYDQNADAPAAFDDGLVAGGVAISRLAARNLGVGVGGDISLPSAGGAVELRVVSVVDDLAGVNSFYVDREVLVRHWPDDGLLGFAVALDRGADPVAVRAAITKAVRDHHLPADVRDRSEAVANLEKGLTALFSISRTVQLAAVLVAALSLTSTAFTTVLERRWTFGLQRALGMSRSQIARSLALEAGAIAVVGALGAVVVGVAIGVLLGQSFSAVAAVQLPLAVPWPLVGLCGAGSVVLSLAATAYPRRLATRSSIIEALGVE